MKNVRGNLRLPSSTRTLLTTYIQACAVLGTNSSVMYSTSLGLYYLVHKQPLLGCAGNTRTPGEQTYCERRSSCGHKSSLNRRRPRDRMTGKGSLQSNGNRNVSHASGLILPQFNVPSPSLAAIHTTNTATNVIIPRPPNFRPGASNFFFGGGMATTVLWPGSWAAL